MYKRIAWVIIAAMFALTACGGSGGGSGSSGDTGTLIVNISGVSANASSASFDAIAKLILPGEEMSPATYIITGKGPAGASFTRTISDEASAQISGLVFGEWQITVEALNGNNVSVAGGEAYATIRSGETTLCNINVSPFEGMGTLDLVINWEAELTNPYLEITLTRKGYDPYEVPYTINQILNNAEVNTEIEAGYYTLQVELYDDNGELSPHIGGAADVVRIAQGIVTSSTITIVSGSTGDDPTSIGGIDNPGFPSPGAPVGSDAISSSTNQSGREAETTPKLNALAGAAFVQAPQIGNYGSVGLSYAMEAPGGRAGMQPGIGLSYSSSGGDGLVGIGWSLNTGLGVITRTTRHSELYYDYRDVFTYNGKRLIKVAGPDYSEEGVYRQEIESGFSRFELTDAGNGGVWRVYDKAGTVTVFGENSDSRVARPDNADKTYIWNFSRSYDLNGNYMQAVYDTSEYSTNRILYLKEIKYTGNYNKGHAPRQFVRFEYKGRDDFYVSKAPGFIMKMTKLLDSVVVGWMDGRDGSWSGTEKELWRYDMVYETSEDSNRPLLKTVNSTRNTTKPEFIYQEAEHFLAWNMVSNPNYNTYTDPSKVKYFEGDFNGDGISDMVFFNPDNGYWRAAQGQRTGGYSFPVYGSRYMGYDSEQKIQFFKGNVTGDYNGDGRSDVAFYLPETKDFIVAEHNGRVFEFKNYGRLAVPGLDIFKCEWFTGDYDGNGLSDAVLFNEQTGEWWLMKNMGGSFSFVKFSKHFQNLFRDDYDPDMNMDSTYTTDDSEYGKHRGRVYFLSGDYNGDGRTDISFYDSRDGKWWVAENYRVTSTNGGVSFALNWKIYKVFTAPEQALFGNDRFSGDFNGDGFSDFLLFNRASGEWILGDTGDGTINFKIFSRAPQFKDITRWLQGDFNGDGRTDIGFYSKTDNNFWIGEATPDGFRYRIYNNLSNGPDPATVLRTPMPKDEVDIKTGSAVVSDAEKTSITEYKYDGNIYEGKGEKVFAGNFTDVPGYLSYRRNATGNLARGWYYAGSGAGSGSGVFLGQTFGVDPEAANIRILNNGKGYRYSADRDGILYYDTASNSFGLISNSGAANWHNDILGTFNDFDFDNGMYMTGDFDGSGNANSLLVLNVVDDLLVYRYNKEKYLLVVNAANIEKDWNWCVENAAKFNIVVGKDLVNASDDLAQLAVQGPLALKAMQKLTSASVEDMEYYTFKVLEFAGIKNVIFSTTGYTGAGGCEIYVKNEDGPKLWKAVFDAGKEFGIRPIGLGARDTLRLEMGYCLYGNDINDQTSPIEAGLGWITKFSNNKIFIDKDFLFNQKEEGVSKRLKGFVMIDRGIPRQHYEVVNSTGELIGEVTSGTMSPMMKQGIGMAYLNKGYWKTETEIFIRIRNKDLKAKIVDLPIYKAN